MSTDEEFLKRLRAAFLDEGKEIVAQIKEAFDHFANRNKAEKSDSKGYNARETISKCASSLHSLKGAARAVNEDELTAVCQLLETAVLSYKPLPDEALERTLLFNLDTFIEIIDALESFVDSEGGITGDGLTDVEKQGLKAMVELKITSLSLDPVKPEEQASPESIRTAESASSIESLMQTGTFNVTELRNMLGTLDNSTEQSASKSKTTQKTEQTIRVPLARLNRLLGESEELLVLKGRMTERLGELTEIKARLDQAARQQLLHQGKSEQYQHSDLKFLANQLDEVLREIGRDNNNSAQMISRFLEIAKSLTMQPISTVLEGFPKLVRELARDLGKDVDFSVEGGHLEIDRRLLERIKDPLIHIIRNALDHGIESPELRSKAGKPSKASLQLSIKNINVENVEISIIDDGAGVNADIVKRKAVERNLLSLEEATNLTYSQALSLIFRPDFSTRDEVSDISGRGLGLAIVKEKVEELSGRLEISSTTGSGTTFRMVLPSKMAAFSGIRILSQQQSFVVPVAGLLRGIRVHPLAFETAGGKRTFFVDGRLIPVASLSKVLGLPEAEHSGNTFEYLEMLVLQHREKYAGLLVDQVVDQGEFTVKPLSYPLQGIPLFSGATMMSSGEVVLILNIHDVVEAVHRVKTDTSSSMLANLLDSLDTKGNTTKPSSERKTVLVVEDSITSRVLLKNILESAGYIVRMALDGAEGLKALATMKTDLVISDIEMPVMDGLTFVKKIRENEATRNTPVILVTSLGSESDRKQGVEAGANAYFIKGNLDQEGLLDTVKTLL